jgi:hypothetical protein
MSNCVGSGAGGFEDDVDMAVNAYSDLGSGDYQPPVEPPAVLPMDEGDDGDAGEQAPVRAAAAVF